MHVAYAHAHTQHVNSRSSSSSSMCERKTSQLYIANTVNLCGFEWHTAPHMSKSGRTAAASGMGYAARSDHMHSHTHIYAHPSNNTTRNYRFVGAAAAHIADCVARNLRLRESHIERAVYTYIYRSWWARQPVYQRTCMRSFQWQFVIFV